MSASVIGPVPLAVHSPFPLPEHGGCGGDVTTYRAIRGAGDLGVDVRAHCTKCGWVPTVMVYFKLNPTE